MKKVYVPSRYIHMIQYILQKRNKQNIRNTHLFEKIFVHVAQKMNFNDSIAVFGSKFIAISALVWYNK